jgi:acetyltransferase-like isoleucine patch superfamily enzyme
MTPPFAPSYYDEAELRTFGFHSVGDNVRVARSCTIIGIPNVSFGNNVRIDGGVVITAATARVEIGSHVHIGGNGFLLGAGGISIGDFCTTSQGVKLYSGSDDYTGEYMTNPTVPAEFTNVRLGRIVLKPHVIVGSTTVVLPGCLIGEGCAIGALSLVKSSLAPWGIYAGAPVRRLKARSKRLLESADKLKA